MVRSSLKRLRGPAHLLRRLAAAFAIACQIGAVGVWPSADAAESQAAQLAAASIFCQGAHHAGDGTAPSPHRHADQAIVNVLSADGHAAILLRHGPFLPGPASGKIGQVTTPQARGPPGLYAASSFPRGPPQPV